MRALLLALLVACGGGPTPPERTNPAPFGADAPPAALQPGDPVPPLTLTDVDGGVVSLADLQGAPVVLEFFNPDCPFVDHAHSRGLLAELPETWAARGVAWIAVNANRPGTNGSGMGRNQRAGRSHDLPRPVVLDESGVVARAFGAKVTPTLAILDGAGRVAYLGGPDNAPMGQAEGGTVRDFATPVLEALVSGAPAPFSRQKAYGCTIKL